MYHALCPNCTRIFQIRVSPDLEALLDLFTVTQAMYKVEWLKYQERVKKKEEDDREKERGNDHYEKIRWFRGGFIRLMKIKDVLKFFGPAKSLFCFDVINRKRTVNSYLCLKSSKFQFRLRR